MAQAGAKKGAAHGEWQVVQRRRRYPDNWKPTFTTAPTKTKPFTPYIMTYAQAVSSTATHPTYPRKTPLPPPQQPQQLKSVPSHTLPPPLVITPPDRRDSKKVETYTSPHSPTKLRFPPSPAFPEWKGRCFRCCKTGHNAALCRNPMKCGRCWKEGHPGNRCLKKGSVPGESHPPPPKVSEKTGYEPLFDELLTGHLPHVCPEMPINRLELSTCFISRDEAYLQEVDLLSQAVLIQALDWEGDLLADMVAEFAVASDKVTLEEITVATLSSSSCLILLPPV